MAVALILIVGMVIFFIFGMPGNSGADEPLPDDNSQVSDVVDEPDRKTDDATLSTDVSEPSNSSSTETPSGTSSSKPSSSSSSSSGSSSTSKPSSSSSSSSSSAKPTTSSKPSSSTQKTETEKFDLFTYCRDFAIDIGTLNGDYCIYQQSAAKYGGSSKEYFSISFWNDSNMVEFCLHCPIDDTQSINFYLRMRGGYNGKYEYLSSNYYRSDGTSFMDATGYIDPAVFSEKYPISCDSYFGSTDNQTNFMEITRVGMCDLIKCLKKFVEVEKMDCGFFAFGFSNF